MIRQPPISPLFPSRRLSHYDRDVGHPPVHGRHALRREQKNGRRVLVEQLDGLPPGALRRRAPARAGARPRSEEHTSELQSRLHLVCRLLLEKKKISTITN